MVTGLEVLDHGRILLSLGSILSCCGGGEDLAMDSLRFCVRHLAVSA